MLNWLDIVLLILFAISMISGFLKGFARIGIGAAVTFFGILFAIAFFGVVGSYFQPYVSSLGVANFLGFVIILVGSSLGGTVLGSLAAKFFRSVGLGWLDRLLGVGVGALRGLLVAIAIVMALVAFTPRPPAKSVVESSIAPYVIDSAKVLVSIAPKDLREGFFQSYDKIKAAWARALRDGSGMWEAPRAQQQ
jgi:membrane protein required for colicin V production